MTPIERIEKAVKWYDGLSRDFADVDRLLIASNRFSCAIFEFSREVGDLYQEKLATEYRRKSAYVRIRSEEIAKMEKPILSAADAAAELQIVEERKEEQLADAMFYRAKLLMDSARDVLDRMNQHISNLKQEKRLEMSGQGSQR